MHLITCIRYSTPQWRSLTDSRESSRRRANLDGTTSGLQMLIRDSSQQQRQKLWKHTEQFSKTSTTAFDLHPITHGNQMNKYADDTYLIIPAFNSQSCEAEFTHVEDWAKENNLTLSWTKLVEIVFVLLRCRCATLIPPQAISGVERFETIKVLGVTTSRKFSVALHIDKLLAECAQSLFALRTLRHHVLPDDAIHAQFTPSSMLWWLPDWRMLRQLGVVFPLPRIKAELMLFSDAQQLSTTGQTQLLRS
jgi:hypothetical protein